MAERPEDQEHAGVSLARYAEIAAELRALGRARTAEVLSRAGVRAEDWEKADTSWKAAIDGDIDGKAGLLLAFAARFSQTRRRLSSAPARSGAETTAEAASPVPEAEAPVLEAEVVVPTFLRAPPPTSPVPTPTAESPGRSLAGTAHLDIHAIVSRILPFEPGKSALQASEAPPNVVAASGPHTTGPAERAPASTPKPPERLDRGSVSVNGASGQTADLDIHHIVSKILPFGAQAAPTPEPSPPALTLEQYASLMAEVAASPERVAETRAKYGVPAEQTYRALNALWERRFAEDGTLRERWLRLVAEYRAWLQQQRR